MKDHVSHGDHENLTDALHAMVEPAAELSPPIVPVQMRPDEAGNGNGRGASTVMTTRLGNTEDGEAPLASRRIRPPAPRSRPLRVLPSRAPKPTLVPRKPVERAEAIPEDEY